MISALLSWKKFSLKIKFKGSDQLRCEVVQGQDIKDDQGNIIEENVRRSHVTLRRPVGSNADGFYPYEFVPDLLLEDGVKDPSFQASGNTIPVSGLIWVVDPNLAGTPGPKKAILSWDASQGATSYKVLRATVAGSPYTFIKSRSLTNYTDTTVTSGTTYYYVVAAVNAAGTSLYSNEVSVTPL